MELRSRQLLYPDEQVVRFLSRRFPSHHDSDDNKTRNALDIGCGSGRHIKLLMDYGFCTWGIDYAIESINIVKKSFGTDLLFQDCLLGDFSKEQWEVKFDVVVGWGVFFLRQHNDIKQDIQNLGKLLTPWGRVFINFRTKENWFYGLGVELEEDCFILDERAGSYKGICYTFTDLADIEKLVSGTGLRIDSVEKTSLTTKSLTELHSWFQVELVSEKA
jgi:SAM-dependent methyltransferase